MPEKIQLHMPEVIHRYLSGETARSIASSLGASYQTVQRRLREAGVPLRGRVKTAATRAAMSAARSAKIDEGQLRELHARGLSVAEIAGALPLGYSEETIRRRMVHLGLERLSAKARPEHNVFWNGGLAVDKYGYILEKAPAHPYRSKNGYVRQHRLVVERQLGRLLLPGEVVDHVNEDTSDNRPENLRLFASNGEHLRHTRTGKPKLSRQERSRLTAEAVRRAVARVAAIRQASGSGAGPSS